MGFEIFSSARILYMIKLEQKLHPSKKNQKNKKKAATHSESVTESAPADFGL